MTYQIAKKLKDAGYPQWTVRVDYKPSGEPLVSKILADNPEYVHFPTLSELIAACGINLKAMIETPEGWKVGNVTYEEVLPGSTPIGTGITLIEAVSNLWLALNKK